MLLVVMMQEKAKEDLRRELAPPRPITDGGWEAPCSVGTGNRGRRGRGNLGAGHLLLLLICFRFKLHDDDQVLPCTASGTQPPFLGILQLQHITSTFSLVSSYLKQPCPQLIGLVQQLLPLSQPAT